MKKLLMALFTVALLNSSIEKVNAGIIVGALAGNVQQGAKLGLVIGAAAGVAVGAGVVIAYSDEYPQESAGMAMILPFVGALAGVVLDIKSDEFANGFEETFSKKYYFIDNREVINQFKNLVIKKLPNSIKEGEIYSVSLTENETRLALEAVQLTPEQTQQVVDDLN